MLIVDVDEALTLMLTTTVTLILTPTIRRHYRRAVSRVADWSNHGLSQLANSKFFMQILVKRFGKLTGPRVYKSAS